METSGEAIWEKNSYIIYVYKYIFFLNGYNFYYNKNVYKVHVLHKNVFLKNKKCFQKILILNL